MYSYNNVLGQLLGKLMSEFTSEIKNKNGGYFLNVENKVSLNELSADMEPNATVARDLDVHPLIGGWIKRIYEQLTFKTATPRNYSWYKKCYVIPWDVNKFSLSRSTGKGEGCWRKRFQDDEGYCAQCAIGYDGGKKYYYPNGSSKCIEYMINNIYSTSSNAWDTKSIKYSRYLMSGKAGEGKSAFLNYILSTKQELMWVKRLIPIRLALTRTEFWKKYQDLLNNEHCDMTCKRHFIEDKIYTKIARILSSKYFTNNIEIPVDKNMEKSFPKELNNIASYYTLTSRDGVYTCFFGFKEQYPNEDEVKILKQYLSTIDNKSEIGKNITDLLNKLRFSLTYKEKMSVMEKVARTLELDIADEKFEFFYKRHDKGMASNFKKEIVIETVKALGELEIPYRYWIILDGLDPHHQNDKIESDIEQMINDLVETLFLESTTLVNASYMLVMREETTSRYLKSALFPGALWGDIIKMTVAPVDPFDIFSNRMRYIAHNEYQAKISECFINFCSHYYNAILNEIPIKKIDFLERNENGFALFSRLFRGNRRTMLKFMNLFIRDVYVTLQKKDINFDLFERCTESKHEQDAINNAMIYYSNIYETHTFWDNVLYRNDVIFFNPTVYSYRVKEKNGSKIKHLQRNLVGIDYEYELFPNIFNCVPIVETMESKNLSLLKIMIMKILKKCNHLNKSELVGIMKILYEFDDTSQIEFEIDELIVNRFISVERYYDEDVIDDPSLRVSEFWDNFENWFFQFDVFAALSSNIKLPNKKIFRYKYYRSYVSRIYEWLVIPEDLSKWRAVTLNAFASKLITTSIVVSYLAAMDWYLRRRYNSKKAELMKISDSLQTVVFDDITIGNGLKKVVVEILQKSSHSNPHYVTHLNKCAYDYMIEHGPSSTIEFLDNNSQLLFETQWWQKYGQMIKTERNK
ncbi:MAG: hypothetical protein HGB12_06220 [Bacteroidetes bacterium]|nr:hypothetical protein [Bacteroidota bacterium]